MADERAHTWTFLSNHGHVLLAVADDPDARIRDIAEERRDNGMVVRVDRVIELENSRHANVIALIIAKR